MPCDQLAHRMATIAQVYTQEPGTRALGVASLIIGYDEENNVPLLYRTDPSGNSLTFSTCFSGLKSYSQKFQDTQLVSKRSQSARSKLKRLTFWRKNFAKRLTRKNGD